MRMKPVDYARLEKAIRTVLLSNPSTTLQTYLDAGLTHMRFRWDMSGASGFDVCALYAYLDDSHIDTALRRITKIGERL